MSVVMRLSANLVESAESHAKAAHRTVPEQITYWARLGKACEDNPEMPTQMVRESLQAEEEGKAGKLSTYTFGA